MTSTSARNARKGATPNFAPAVLRARHDGWTPERQLRFIEGLARSGNVKAAARAAGMSVEAAYSLRRHPEADGFRAAWLEALDLGTELLEDKTMQRAIEGVEVPVFHMGRRIGTRRVHNDRLAMYFLNRADERRAERQRIDPADREQLMQLKARWRREFAREKAIEQQAREEASGESFLQKIKAMHAGWYLQLGPEARALYRRFREAEKAWYARDRATEQDDTPREAVWEEYLEFFGAQADPRPEAAKLGDMRMYELREEEMGGVGEDAVVGEEDWGEVQQEDE